MLYDQKFFETFVGLNSNSISNSLYLKLFAKVEDGYLIGQEGRIVDVKVVAPHDWLKIDELQETAQWHYHRIGGGCGFLLSKYTQYNAELINNIVTLWIEANKITNGFPNSKQAWSGHTVGLRLDFICNYYLYCLINDYSIPNINKIIETINYHLDYILEESNYDGNWNHGLDQSIALLKASYLLSNNEGKDFAVQRILENFKHSFDREGVNNEQSIMYHDYNITRYSLAFKLLDIMKINKPNIQEIMDKAKLFLVHSLDPKGYYSMIGDTVLKQPLLDSRNSYVDYLVTGGESGLKPFFDTKKIYKAGYIFGRSSWESIQNPSYYTLRFGPGRLVHGHNDHMGVTYFSDFTNILVDGGFHGYKSKQDKLRAHLLSPNAHNVVFSKKYRKYNWSMPTIIMNSYQSDEFDFYTFYDFPYRGVRRFRSIMIDINNDFILVHDQIISDTDAEFIQSWNIGHQLEVKTNNNIVDLTLKDSNYFLIGDSMAKLEIIKGSVSSKDNNEQVLGGYEGLGHNHIEEINTIHYEKYGKDLVWFTAFAKNKSTNLIKINQSAFILENTFYQIVDQDNWLKVLKANIDISYINYDTLSMSFSGHLIVTNNEFLIKNTTNERKYFDLRLDDLLQNGIYGLLIELKVVSNQNNEPTYYYITGSSQKRRFGTLYVYQKHSMSTIIRIPISSNCKVSIAFNISRIRAIDYKVFPSATNLVNQIYEIA